MSIELHPRELKAAIAGVSTSGHWKAGTKATWAMASADPEAATLLELSAFLCRLVFLRDFFTICTRAMLSFKVQMRDLLLILPQFEFDGFALSQYRCSIVKANKGLDT